MKIIEQSFLRGPNLYSSQPCLMTVIDLQEFDGVSSSSLPGFNEELLNLLPTLREQCCRSEHAGIFAERLEVGMHLAEAVERVTLELQCLSGTPVNFGTGRRVAGKPGHYRVICAYQLEKVVEQACSLAIDVVTALARGERPDIGDALASLRQATKKYAIGTSTAAILQAAHARGIPSVRLTEEANLFQLGWGSRQKRLQATVTGMTSRIAVGVASNKQLTKALLEQVGIPVPKGGTVSTREEALKLAQRLGPPVTIKPLDANHGKGVTTICANADEIATAFAHAQKYSRHVIVERFLEGQDYRVLVTGGRVAAASRRRPPEVTGDGVRTVRELVDTENLNPLRGAGHSNILTKIPLDEHAEAILARQGYTLESIPDAGTVVTLRGNANLSTGGTPDDVTDLLPQETRDICVRAARKIGLDVAGIDIVCKDIARPLREQGGGIIEVNAAPGIRMHQYPVTGQPRDAGAAIIDALYGQEDGRIPTIAVTGSSGTTATSLLIAYASRLAGLNTGAATTNGSYINGYLTKKGDCTGYWSTRGLLASPEVDLAVLETKCGGILKRGLAFDRCDVSVVMNVGADPSDTDDETVEELALANAVVACAASRAVVLNAEDQHCVAMAAKLRPGTELIYFSLDPNHPVLMRHLAQHGRAVCLADKRLVIADGRMHKGLMQAEPMPVPVHGLAHDNIPVMLAATAALLAGGFQKNHIFTALEGILKNGKNDQLASTLHVGGAPIVTAY